MTAAGGAGTGRRARAVAVNMAEATKVEAGGMATGGMATGGMAIGGMAIGGMAIGGDYLAASEKETAAMDLAGAEGFQAGGLAPSERGPGGARARMIAAPR